MTEPSATAKYLAIKTRIDQAKAGGPPLNLTELSVALDTLLIACGTLVTEKELLTEGLELTTRMYYELEGKLGIAELEAFLSQKDSQ